MTMTVAVVADAMVTSPVVCSVESTVREIRTLFADDHVHAALLIDDGRLVCVLERGDLESARPHHPAARYGTLLDRTVDANTPLDVARRRMSAVRRRLAVVDDTGVPIGLLCLKPSGTGFCSDDDVRARADERHDAAALTRPV